MTLRRRPWLCIFLLLVPMAAGRCIAESNAIKVTLQSQNKEGDTYRMQHRDEVWQAGETAVIVCDMWDAHHCYRAVLRENQMVPRMEELLTELRSRGVTVIHAPSSCMAVEKRPSGRRG